MSTWRVRSSAASRDRRRAAAVRRGLGLLGLVLVLAVLVPLGGFRASEPVPPPEAASSVSAGGVDASSDAASSDDGPDAEKPGGDRNALRSIVEAKPGQTISAGDLEVTLVAIGLGPVEDIGGGERLVPQPGTHRLSARIEVRNSGSSTQPVRAELTDRAISDEQGHRRPMIMGTDRLIIAGAARDDSGQELEGRLGPGGVAALSQSWVVRDDDRDRRLYLEYRASDDTLVRFLIDAEP